MASSAEYLELNEESRIEQARHAEVLRAYETQKRARSIIVPTAIEDIKARLRELGQPVTLFGEGHADRRERLREVIAKFELDEESAAQVQALLNKSTGAASSSAAAEQAKPVTQKEIFYSPACEELIEMRKDISSVSFERTHARLLAARDMLQDEAQLSADRHTVHALYTHSSELTLNLSQFGDDRPLTSICYTKDGSYLLSGCLTNALKVWDAGTLSPRGSLVGHTERITSVAHSGGIFAAANKHVFASSSADGAVCIWDGSACIDEEGGMDIDTPPTNGLPRHCLHRLEGSSIVNAVDFHPFAPLLASACADFSWRLWDARTGQQLLLQDGHVRECCALAFHPDGSLIYTADAGGVGLLWDIRSGQMIQGFQGHGKKVTDVSCHPNGFQIATSSSDNTVKVWDLRRRKCSYTLPAHTSVISSVKYSASGEVLLTASFDGTLKLWGSRDYSILRTLSGHTGKVMAADFAPDERHVASAGYDRTVKLWAHKDEF